MTTNYSKRILKIKCYSELLGFFLYFLRILSGSRNSFHYFLASFHCSLYFLLCISWLHVLIIVSFILEKAEKYRNVGHQNDVWHGGKNIAKKVNAVSIWSIYGPNSSKYIKAKEQLQYMVLQKQYNKTKYFHKILYIYKVRVTIVLYIRKILSGPCNYLFYTLK